MLVDRLAQDGPMLRIGDVAGDCFKHRFAELRDYGLEVRCCAGIEDQPPTVVSQAMREGAAKATGGTGHQGQRLGLLCRVRHEYERRT